MDSEGARELHQQRVALLAKVQLAVAALVQVLVWWVQHQFARATFASGAAWTAHGHLLVVAAIVTMWLRTRAGRRSHRELAVFDITCVVLPVAYSGLALWNVDPLAQPSMVLLITAMNTSILRSVLVPSSGRRTGILAALLVVYLVTWTHLQYRAHAGEGAPPPTLHSVPIFVWAVLSGIIATVASHTIFGLRQQVRDAMQIGQYTLTRKIGEGGMGVVWEARHALLRRRTAVKLLPAERAGDEAIARFEREVQLTSALTHPNTIAIYDYGRSADGVFYYAMEFIDGVDLETLVHSHGPQPPGLVAHILAQMCDALAEAHRLGLVHRDVKPANVMLCERGGVPLVVKMLDFGLVKRVEAQSKPGLSTTETILGTPLYMAPEAMTSPDTIDARSDLYAVGAVGYYLLTGRPVFPGETVLEIFAHHLQTLPRRPSEVLGAPVPADLEAIVLECLAKDPSRRPASAAALSARLGATEVKKSWTTESSEDTWQRLRREATPGAPTPSEPPRLTVALRGRS